MSDDRHERVSRRAYELWEQQGGEHGRHEDHWHSASAEIDGAPPAEEEASVTAPDGTTLTASPAGETAGASPVEAKPARKRAAPKATAKTPPAEKAPAKPRKPK